MYRKKKKRITAKAIIQINNVLNKDEIVLKGQNFFGSSDTHTFRIKKIQNVVEWTEELKRSI